MVNKRYAGVTINWAHVQLIEDIRVARNLRSHKETVEQLIEEAHNKITRKA